MKEVHETEYKYDVDPEFRMPYLADAVNDATDQVIRDDPVELDATYFDTDDLRLLRAGVTLRRRYGGSDAGWHLKLPEAGAHSRNELQYPFAASSWNEPPTEIVDLAFAYSLGATVNPVARLRTTRTATRIIGGSGKTIIEVADDQVTSFRFADRAEQGWRELEVELQPGAEQLAKQVGKMLRESGARRSSRSSKLATVLDSGDPKAADAPARRHAKRSLLAKRISEQFDELVARDIDVRRGEKDGIHDMRVATRRLRGCLRTFRSMLGRERADHLGEELQWLASALGAVRDAEVLGERIRSMIVDLSPEDLSESIRTRLTVRVATEMGAARTTLDEVLRSPRYIALLGELTTFRDRIDAQTDVDERKLIRSVAKEVQRTRRRVRAGRRASGHERDVTLHEARKLAKRVRYAAETIEPAFGRRAHTLANRFSDIQEVLGDRHDAVVTRTFLCETAEQSGIGEHRRSYAVLVFREDAKIAAADREFVQFWDRARRASSWLPAL